MGIESDIERVPLDATAATTEPDPLQVYADALQGFGHPIRIRALVLMETEQSPGALAGIMRQPLGVVSYHVRMLRDYGLVELDRTEPRRGALQHFYHRSDLAEDLLAKLAGFFDVPPTKAGKRGTEKRMAELQAWARKDLPPVPEEEAEEAAA